MEKSTIYRKHGNIRWIGEYSISNGLIHIKKGSVEEELVDTSASIWKDPNLVWAQRQTLSDQLIFPVADIDVIAAFKENQVSKQLEKTNLKLARKRGKT